MFRRRHLSCVRQLIVFQIVLVKYRNNASAFYPKRQRGRSVGGENCPKTFHEFTQRDPQRESLVDGRAESRMSQEPTKTAEYFTEITHIKTSLRQKRVHTIPRIRSKLPLSSGTHKN